jgi:hypothetical protein
MMAPVFFDDPHFNFIPYNPWLAYGQSKTANVLIAVEATRRWANAGIFANALNPGAIPTNLQRHVGGKLVTPPEKQKTTQQGAATSVLLATSRQLEGIGGRYFEDCREASVVDRRPDEFGGGVAPWDLDPKNVERLWSLATTMLRYDDRNEFQNCLASISSNSSWHASLKPRSGSTWCFSCLSHGSEQHQQHDGNGIWCADRRPRGRRIAFAHGGLERQHNACGRADESADAALKDRRRGHRLLIKHAFPAQCVLESLGGLIDQKRAVIGAFDGDLRGYP